MADSGRVVDVVGTDEPGRFLGDIVALVGEASRGQVEGNALRVGGANARGDQRHGFIPLDASKTAVALAPHHRIGQPAEFSQLSRCQVIQIRDVVEFADADSGHCVEAQEFEPDGAQVNSVDGEIVESGSAQGASVADSAGEDPPCIGQLLFVAPNGSCDFEIVIGFGVTDAVRNEAYPG